MTLHQKIKFLHEGKVVTITAEIEAVPVTLKLTSNEILDSPGFEVCTIYEDELNPKISSIMKNMNFMPGIGLGKNQQGASEFIEPKVPILKYRLGYQKSEKSKAKDKGKAKR